MAAVVGVDVVVARIPSFGGHVDPAVELDLDDGVLARPHLDGTRDGPVFEAAPGLKARLAGGEGHREAAVAVEVVVLGNADDAGIAAVGEVRPPVGARQIDARRQQLPAGVGDAHPQLAGRLRPCVAVDAHAPRLTASPPDRVERKAHPVVDGARLVVGAAVAGKDDALAIR